MSQEWAHLQALVDGLVEAGNEVVDGGFRPTQGGWECGLRLPLNAGVARSFAASDDRVTYDEDRDEVACRHCWTMIYGGTAATRYRREHQDAVERRAADG